ncbi:MAG: efflux RND transporter periplasmic adaptor subunit [Bacteroidales bacterium]|nr:efflux RND transporter periplasmic adaptor subunit [Bacteroidales bacterium]
MKKTIIAAALILLAGCAPKTEQQQTTFVSDQSAPIVEVMTVSKQSVPQDQVYSATIQAYVVNNIAPQTAARIHEINVEVGDFVTVGQVLAEMDRLQLDQAGLKLKNAEDEFQRLEQLYLEGGVSQSDFESMQLSYNVSKSSYDNIYENTILKSPVNGVITARNYDKGDMYSMAQPIFTVQQITPVKILVPVSESDYTKVKRGDRVNLTVDALPERNFVGSVVRLHPTMDAATHTFYVEVQVSNENRALRPGMYARVKINFGDTFNVVVPDDAVVKLQGSGLRSVFVLGEDNVATLKNVTLGRHYDSKYEILSGLEGGETIVVKGQAVLKSGVKVEVKQ